MKLTNWLKAGRQSKKEQKVIANINAHKSGSLADSQWDDYLQISFYSKEKGAFVRLTMDKNEAAHFHNKFASELNKIAQ